MSVCVDFSDVTQIQGSVLKSYVCEVNRHSLIIKHIYQWGHPWARSQAHKLDKCTHQTHTHSPCRECKSNSSSPLLYGSPGDTHIHTRIHSMKGWKGLKAPLAFSVTNLTHWWSCSAGKRGFLQHKKTERKQDVPDMFEPRYFRKVIFVLAAVQCSEENCVWYCFEKNALLIWQEVGNNSYLLSRSTDHNVGWGLSYEHQKPAWDVELWIHYKLPQNEESVQSV